MEKLKTFLNSPDNWIYIVLLAALLVRIPGIFYALPMWLVEDEPAFVTSALKMIEIKTLLPVLHQDQFRGLLYYQPLVPYLYLGPFSMILGIKYLLHTGSMQEFSYSLTSDLSIFFIAARIIALILSLFSIWLLSKIASRLTRNPIIGIISAIFLSFNLLHLNFSYIGKEWMPVVAMYLIAIYFLSHPSWSISKRFVLSGLAAGIAFGFGNVGGFLMPLILLWYIFIEKRTLFEALKEKFLYQTLLIFLSVASLATAIAPFDFFIVGGERTIREEKTLLGIIGNFDTFLRPIIKTEPIMAFFAAIGLIVLYRKARNYFWLATTFMALYISTFYMIFYHQHRYTLPLQPILSLLAGIGFYIALQKVLSKNQVAGILLISATSIILISGALKFDQILLNNDARLQAFRWIEQNLPEDSKIATYAELTHITSNKNAITEQESIDSKSLRRIDRSERYFDGNPYRDKRFHAINLYSVSNKNFFENIETYLKNNKYKYLLISLEKTPNLDHLERLTYIAQSAKLIRSFDDPNKLQPEKTIIHHFTIDNFGNFLNLFKLNTAGQTVALYELNY